MAAIQNLVGGVAGGQRLNVNAESISIVDTHTAGEPTRIVVECPFDLGRGSLAEKRDVFRQQFDRYRNALVCEPRGSDVMVGGLITEPDCDTCLAGVIFFNNVGYLGMCGHGTMGVAVALQHLGRIELGKYQLDTPVGKVDFELSEQNRVSVNNVPSYRFQKTVQLQLPDGRQVHGDIAWGGNWFYICSDHGLQIEPSNIHQLDSLARQIRRRLDASDIRGADDQLIDHVELVGEPSLAASAHARNFVLCPGGAYDRSPCGTGTSAKLACMAADGSLAPGQIYRQESILGSVFEGSYLPLEDGKISPSITGQAYVNGQGQILIDPDDPFAMGIAFDRGAA